MSSPSRLLLTVVFCCAASAQTGRDFSGRWFLKPAQSEMAPSGEAPDPMIRIEQQESAIHLYRIGDGDKRAEEIRTYNLDGRESKRRDGSVTVSSMTKWEGAALLINTNVSSSQDSYSVSDRWKLSRDGSRLTIRREIIRRTGESESTLVYERESKPTPPVLVIAAAPQPARSEPVAPPLPAAAIAFQVPQGTKLPLRLMNSVSTKHSAPGDKVYLETVYPILSRGKVIIPPGSYVMGSLTEVKQAGRVKGRSEMFLRFDTLTLPNGTTRDFRARMSNMDGDGKGSLDRKEGRVEGDGGKGGDTRTVAEAAAAGTGIGAIAGGAAGHLGMGAGIGAAAGALGGLVGVLATRGPDAVLQKGSTVEMTLDRDLSFSAEELASH